MTWSIDSPKIQIQHFGIRDSAAGRSAVLFFIVSLAGQPEDALHPIRACSERGDLMSDFELLYLLLQFALVVIGILSLYNKK